MLLISRKRIVRTKTEITECTTELVPPGVLAGGGSQSADISRKEMKRPTTRKIRSGSTRALGINVTPPK